MRVPKRKSEEFRKYNRPDNTPVFVTQEGLERFKRQLARLEKELPDLIAEVQRTGAFGDFSENAEYQAAKYLLRRTHGRIAALKDQPRDDHGDDEITTAVADGTEDAIEAAVAHGAEHGGDMAVRQRAAHDDGFLVGRRDFAASRASLPALC